MIIKNADTVAQSIVDVPGAAGAEIRLLIHQAEGAPNFYMRQFNVAPGGCTPRHSHDWEHEVYILSGSGLAVTGSAERDIHVGDCVYVPPNEEHQFRNAAPGELKFLCLVPASSRKG